MSWLSQFSLVMRSSVASLREKIEDPERMLHQLIVDMEEELDGVRASVAEAVADEIQMRKRAQRERSEAQKWLERATSAMKCKDESSARSALDQKLAANERAERFDAEHAKQQVEVSKLERSVRDLEDKIRQAKQKKTLLAARMARATSTQKIHTAMERTRGQSALAQFGRFEERVQREESLNEAWERLDGKDPAVAELETQFEANQHKQKLEAELAELKSRLDA